MELSPSNSQFLSELTTVIFDCDGVLWDAKSEAIAGSPEALNKLREMGKRIFFITNNSTKTRKQYADRCKQLGINANEEEILCTAWLAAAYLSDVLQYTGRVYLVGGMALHDELTTKGLSVVGAGEEPYCATGGYTEYMRCELDPDVKAVVVGFDPYINYPKVVKAASYLQRPDCLYVATNMDSYLPNAGSPIRIPGTGSIIEFVSYAAEKQPLIAGKPETLSRDILEKLYGKLDPSKTMMVGDRLNTDMKFGNNCGFRTLFVLSGAHTVEDMRKYMASNSVEDQKCVPQYYTNTVGDLLKYLQQ